MPFLPNPTKYQKRATALSGYLTGQRKPKLPVSVVARAVHESRVRYGENRYRVFSVFLHASLVQANHVAIANELQKELELLWRNHEIEKQEKKAEKKASKRKSPRSAL